MLVWMYLNCWDQVYVTPQCVQTSNVRGKNYFYLVLVHIQSAALLYCTAFWGWVGISNVVGVPFLYINNMFIQTSNEETNLWKYVKMLVRREIGNSNLQLKMVEGIFTTWQILFMLLYHQPAKEYIFSPTNDLNCFKSFNTDWLCGYDVNILVHTLASRCIFSLSTIVGKLFGLNLQSV